MKITQNEGFSDRIIRIFAAEVLFLLAFFWFGGALQILLAALVAVLLITGLLGFCGIYALFGLNTCAASGTAASTTVRSFVVLFLVAVLIGGSYASNFFAKKFFLEDYSAMNQYYKQTLFFTGQGNRVEAVANYEKLIFHDAMEQIIAAADAKNADLVVATYPDVSDKLRAVEAVADDAEIMSIRKNLEQLLALAKAKDTASLSGKAAELKSSFVKVYLKRG